MKAYVLVSLSEPNEQSTLDYFSNLPDVKEAHILFGEWDLILELKAIDAEQIGSFVIEKVRSHEDVELTSTLIVAK